MNFTSVGFKQPQYGAEEYIHDVLFPKKRSSNLLEIPQFHLN